MGDSGKADGWWDYSYAVACWGDGWVLGMECEVKSLAIGGAASMLVGFVWLAVEHLLWLEDLGLIVKTHCQVVDLFHDGR